MALGVGEGAGMGGASRPSSTPGPPQHWLRLGRFICLLLSTLLLLGPWEPHCTSPPLLPAPLVGLSLDPGDAATSSACRLALSSALSSSSVSLPHTRPLLLCCMLHPAGCQLAAAFALWLPISPRNRRASQRTLALGLLGPWRRGCRGQLWPALWFVSHKQGVDP